ncbi:MAG: PEP-CTERM sorting domain-containing protein [Chromatiaceae bacterium]|nr:PEP-CTERM sorting domain-containing protein [Gammaproteobacteria bacterium]MCP5422038.1 PEP-CTERM sorting domain-containing protein [Chromatiaceae bacterium]
MHGKAYSILMAIVLGWCGGAQATILFSSDTGTELLGSWEAVGFTSLESLTSAAFGPLLPDGNSNIGLRKENALIEFGTFGVGSPDNPFEAIPIPGVDTLFADYSGTFNNNVSGTDVYFLFSNLQTTAGVDGTFTGNFCFSTDPTACALSVPEPATLALTALGLLAAGIGRATNKQARRKGN